MKQNGALILIVAVLLLAILAGAASIINTGDTEEGFFDQVNFIQNRLPLTSSTGIVPTGSASIDYIIHINDHFYDRFPYTHQEMRTAGWIVEELLAMGYSWGDIEIQEFTIDDAHIVSNMAIIMELLKFIDQSPFVNIDLRNSDKSQNVILTVPGQSEEVIIVGAHYDSVFFPGASDNASGVALLMESALRMSEKDNYYTIKYIFFGAEEVGLFGSFFYVFTMSQAQRDNLLFMINADILLDGDDLFYMAGYVPDTGRQHNDPPGVNYITESWDLIANDTNSHYNIDLKALPWGVFGPSDQLAFLPHGHTAMFLAGLDAGKGIPVGDISPHLTDLSRVLHTSKDDIHFIMETWPGKVEENMRSFSIFLEEILLAKYYTDEH